MRIDGVAADADRRNQKGGTDRGAALVTTRALYARSVRGDGGGDDDVRQSAHSGTGDEAHSRARGKRSLHSIDLDDEEDRRTQTRDVRIIAQQEQNVYGRILSESGSPLMSSRTIGAIFVAVSGASIFSRSPTITIARWSGSTYFCATRTTSSFVTAFTARTNC